MKTTCPLVALSALASCEAFVPSSKQPICSQQSQQTRTAYRPAVSPTALSMGVGNGFLFDRFSRVLKSNVNKFVSGMENPEKVIIQAVDDMQSDLVKVRQAYAEATASQRRLHQRKKQADALATDWYNRAQLALRSNNEGLAKEALTRRQLALEQAQGLDSEIQMQQVAIDKLYSAMSALEAKIREAASKKEQLIARARTAKSTQEVNDMLSGLTGKTSMDAFARMESKVEALEAAAEVSAESSIIGGNVKDSLEAEFMLLEQSSQVDQELQDLKNMMKGTKVLSGSSVTPLKKTFASTMEEGLGESIHERVSIPVGRGEKFYIQ